MFEWIEGCFKEYFGVTRQTTWLETILPAGTNIIHDEKACEECRSLQKDNCISPEGLVIVSEKAICQVDIESFFRQMNGLKAAEGLCCDFLFADGVRKIVFCDLTCSLRKYILPFRNSRGYQQGKRAKAYHQISSTIDKLMAVPNVAQYIHQMPLKIGLFAERDKDSATSDVAIKNMMLMMPDYSMENHLSTDMGNGFQFVTVHYPQAYQW